jgi:hypothetical protein
VENWEEDNELSGSARGGKGLEHLGEYRVLKKNSVPWSYREERDNIVQTGNKQ